MSGITSLAGEHPRRGVGRRVVVFESCASTNDEARALLGREGAASAHGTVCIAREQRAGRGTRGRAWWSPKGASLALSVVLVPDAPLARPAGVTLAGALALLEAARARGADLLLKWPNDLVDRGGAKAAGVLAERVGGEPGAYVLGIGVNLRATAEQPPAYLAVRWTCLETAGAAGLDDVAFTHELLGRLDAWWMRFTTEGSACLAAAFDRASWLTGREVRLRRGEERRSGTFRGLGERLEVRLELADGSRLEWPGEQVELDGVENASD